MDERSYIAGQQQAWLSILREARTNLDSMETEGDFSVERAETVLKLRAVCEEFGDNDWPDNLHLVDVIEKHLLRYLEERSE